MADIAQAGTGAVTDASDGATSLETPLVGLNADSSADLIARLANKVMPDIGFIMKKLQDQGVTVASKKAGGLQLTEFKLIKKLTNKVAKDLLLMRPSFLDKNNARVSKELQSLVLFHMTKKDKHEVLAVLHKHLPKEHRGTVAILGNEQHSCGLAEVVTNFLIMKQKASSNKSAAKRCPNDAIRTVHIMLQEKYRAQLTYLAASKRKRSDLDLHQSTETAWYEELAVDFNDADLTFQPPRAADVTEITGGDSDRFSANDLNPNDVRMFVRL
jgi:hypothetical protein